MLGAADVRGHAAPGLVGAPGVCSVPLRLSLSSGHFQTPPGLTSFCQVTGVVSDADGKAHYVMSGTWDEKMECSKIVQSSHGSTSTEGKQKTVYQTLSPKVLWKKYPLP